MARFSALLDACVLVPIALADALLHLAEEGLFRPLWSDEILDEAERALANLHQQPRSRFERRFRAMDGAFPDACVRGWRPLVPGVSVRDPQDAHVVAAALSGRADVIVTFNTKDFEADFLASQGLEVQHPDVFLANQLDLDPDATMIALPRQACGKVNPRMSLPELLTSLERCQVGDFARAARGQIWRT